MEVLTVLVVFQKQTVLLFAFGLDQMLAVTCAIIVCLGITSLVHQPLRSAMLSQRVQRQAILIGRRLGEQAGIRRRLCVERAFIVWRIIRKKVHVRRILIASAVKKVA